MTTSDTLPARLRAWRAAHGWTQAEAAEALGANVRTLQGWERGGRYAPGATVEGLLARLIDLMPPPDAPKRP